MQPQIPQFSAAQAAATWVAGQQAADGSIGGSPSTTASGILALAAAHVDTSGAEAAMTYLETNAGSYITVDNADGPGRLANLILDAHAMGVDPTNFGRDQPRDAVAGHGANLGAGRWVVRDRAAVE